MATKSIAWNTGTGNITLTYQGQGDGAISVQSDANEGSARSQVITVETVGGAITRNFTVSQAACPVPVGTVLNYSYTGSYQEVTLPAGQYKLQCWGAQGGSNAAASSYSITAKAGGKGGYSEGIITLSQKTTVRVYVGGAGSSSAGGFNGGGSTTGSSTYNASNEQGVSRMGGGGGATDIRLSDGALLSRMIVAGGGSGGAMCYRSKTTSSTGYTQLVSSGWSNDYDNGNDHDFIVEYSGWENGKNYKVVANFPITLTSLIGTSGFRGVGNPFTWFNSSYSGYSSGILVRCTKSSMPSSPSIQIYKEVTTSSTVTSNDSQAGYAGGGTSGLGNYPGTQSSAGSGGSFGAGAAMSASNYRYCSGAGGGGWYGGGSAYSDTTMGYVRYMGGGSGFVNTAASAGNRPSGYTGLELDSGTTYAGNTSFPNTAGTGNETGHSGNGYAKITRLS